MPELPEVETIRRQLTKVLSGKEVEKIEVLREKSFSGDPNKIKGWVIDKVDRKSKVLEIYFKNKNDLVICHLKMTGQLIFTEGQKRIAGGHPTADWVRDLPSKHTRIIWYFKDGSKLFFNDMRVFGWMRLTALDKYEKDKKKAAPDIIDNEFTKDYLFDVLKKSKKAIKLILLDQEKIGGAGNIYVNDALFLAKILPTRSASTITRRESDKIWENLRRVIDLGIVYGGASAADDKYVNTSGLGGKYQEHFQVYQREGQNCRVCGTKIEKIKIGGRGTYYCPHCQK